MSVVSYSISSDPPVPCKCGTIPEVGMTFYYTSKYTGSLIEGIIGKVGGPLNIVSTNGIMSLDMSGFIYLIWLYCSSERAVK